MIKRLKQLYKNLKWCSENDFAKLWKDRHSATIERKELEQRIARPMERLRAVINRKG
jgi:hypothetical protein